MNRTLKYIKELSSTKGLKLECPNCNEVFTPRSAKLFDVTESPTRPVQQIFETMWDELESRKESVRERSKEITMERKEAKESLAEKPKLIENTTESVNFGQIAEKIFPSFTNFPYHHLDCRALFDPVDYIIFSGLKNNGKIDFIKFADVKTGQARLSNRQKQIRDAVNSGKVKLKIGKFK